MQTIEWEGLSYDFENDSFIKGVAAFDIARYLKGKYRGNLERFEERFLNPLKEAVIMYDRPEKVHCLDIVRNSFIKREPFSYKEAFEIQHREFQALVFGSINVPEMISNLGSERIATEGIPVKHRKYKEDYSYEMIEYTCIYELHKINIKELTQRDDHAFAIKCWCTSTDKEHWLWVDEKAAAKGIKEAVASMCVVYKNLIPYIKHIKRQGDVFLFELTQEVFPQGELVSLTADQYFGWLIAQS